MYALARDYKPTYLPRIAQCHQARRGPFVLPADKNLKAITDFKVVSPAPALLRVALQNPRDDLLAFAGVLDAKLADIAQAHVIPEPLVREACVLHRLPSTSTAYWQGWNRLRAKLGDQFHRLFDAVSWAMAQTPRSSSLVENLNSRLFS